MAVSGLQCLASCLLLLLLLVAGVVRSASLRRQLQSPAAGDAHCPNQETRPYFHGMINLPKKFAPNKVSFRSCVSHVNETVIADIPGPGSIQKFWLVTGMGAVKVRPNRCVFTRDAMMMVLRIYFDGETTPSIEAPLGPMFGFHHDLLDEWGNTLTGYGADNSLFKVTENGALTLLAPMPFANGCKITLQDETPDNAVKMRIWSQISYYQFDPRCPMPETKRLHAIYRKEFRDVQSLPGFSNSKPHKYRRSMHLAHGQGKGYLLGATMGFTVKDFSDQWFHNGAELIILDHSTNPRVLKGTGGEDFFCTSCWFNKHHNFPDWGFMYGENHKFFSAYRWFISDFQLPFESEFAFQYGANRDEIGAVVYWYQEGPAMPVQKHIPWPMRDEEIPIPQDYFLPAPTGGVPYWNFTCEFLLSRWSHHRTPHPKLSYEDTTLIAPMFGFISIGEYYFTYHTNEGYPVNVYAWGRAEVQSAIAQEVTMHITVDDPALLWLNNQVVFNNSEVLDGFHTFQVSTSLQAGSNELIVKLANTENVNTRAWVLGLNIYYGDDRQTAQAKVKDLQYFQQRAVVKGIDGACE